jgi:hypothetical protein
MSIVSSIIFMMELSKIILLDVDLVSQPFMDALR